MSNLARLIVIFVTGLFIALNATFALNDARKSRYFRFGIDIAFAVYWTLLMAKLVLN